MKSRIKFTDYLSELMLFSGQYALFYIFMNLSNHGLLFFANYGHMVLLVSLLLQTVVATHLNSHPNLKVFATFIAPTIYTLVEIKGNPEWLLNIGHLFFWVYTLLLALLWWFSTYTETRFKRIAAEFAITFVNVSIFIFVYFYFDLRLSVEQQLQQGLVSAYQAKELLEIYHIHTGFLHFLEDPAHVFIIFGGAFLGVIISLGRIKILSLNEKINQVLAQYMDAKIRDRIVIDGEISQKKRLVILFCDIRNFSQISERYEADKVVGSLNLYYGEWSRIVAEHGGVINKFIGDAVMVIFGLEGSESTAAKQSIDCSKKVLERLPAINQKLKNNGLPEIENIGIGIHGGNVILGSIGGEDRRDYTVIGDNVNIAQRVESFCKQTKRQLIITDTLYALLETEMREQFDNLGEEMLKGKEIPMNLYGMRTV